MFKTVLFPIDQSREAAHTAELVTKFVKSHNSQLTLLSVVEENADGGEQQVSGMASPEAVAALLSKAQEMFAQQGITATVVERLGKPAFTICDVADELEVDLIIMGCRGTGLTQEGIDDSITAKVINLSPCPVLVIP